MTPNRNAGESLRLLALRTVLHWGDFMRKRTVLSFYFFQSPSVSHRSNLFRSIINSKRIGRA